LGNTNTGARKISKAVDQLSYQQFGAKIMLYGLSKIMAIRPEQYYHDS
jgi:hypothetical protein